MVKLSVLLHVVIVALVALVCVPQTAAARFNIVDFGAVGDGKTPNQAAIKRAVQAAALQGGGNVFVPKGEFVSGAFNLSSRVYLEFDIGGVIRASADASLYPCIPSVTSDTGRCDYPLIAAVGATTTGILGPGVVNGGANDPPGNFVDRYEASTNFLVPKEWPLPLCSFFSCRPKLVVFKQCTGVTLQNVTLANSPLWTLSFVQSRNILVDGVTISGDRRWPNNDGIDIIDSSDVIVRNAKITAGDDCVAVITHSRLHIRNVTVSDCYFESTSAAFKISAFDANATGDISDITFEKTIIRDSNRGVCIDPRWGKEPLYVTSMSASTEHRWTGIVRDVTFTDIKARSENGIVVYSATDKEAALARINSISFERVEIEIARFSNISSPAHDWRPSIPPELFFAASDGLFFDGVDKGSLIDTTVVFASPRQPFWGICLNVTRSEPVAQQNFNCIGGP